MKKLLYVNVEYQFKLTGIQNEFERKIINLLTDPWRYANEEQANSRFKELYSNPGDQVDIINQLLSHSYQCANSMQFPSLQDKFDIEFYSNADIFLLKLLSKNGYSEELRKSADLYIRKLLSASIMIYLDLFDMAEERLAMCLRINQQNGRNPSAN